MLTCFVSFVTLVSNNKTRAVVLAYPLSKSIVTLHKGVLTVESNILVSETEMTTTFKIQLKNEDNYCAKHQLFTGNYQIN